LIAHAGVESYSVLYQIVYKEIQRYLFKIGAIDLPDGRLLSGIVDFFEEGVATGKGVLKLIGNDVAVFCDDLVKDSRTYADIYQESISGEPSTAEQQHPSTQGTGGRHHLSDTPSRRCRSRAR
jgi:DNA-binding ferritin-like protein (Dps family)